MAIDPKQPVRVIKDITTGGGNSFPARESPYQPGEIPPDFLNEEYCTQKGVQFRPLADAAPATITLKPGANETITLAMKEGELKVEGEDAKFNINFASPERITTAIAGIDAQFTEKLDAMRQEKPFASIADLQKRCPLPKELDKAWSNYKDAITF